MAERNPYIPAYVPKDSIRVSCIQHANVATSDVKRSQEWYKKVFNAEWTEEHPRYLKLGNSELHIVERTDPRPHESNHFAVEVEDWEAWVANLARVGVTFDREPRENDGKLSGFLRDPDGNRIEVMYHAAWHKVY
jgi:catechol 2,3-dioxygenase-like lactoylglutathione lyase family enzyme